MNLYNLLCLTQFTMFILNVVGSHRDWRRIEMLAEKHPYVVAILNQTKDYVCTGTILDDTTVLTSGGCINPKPHYVAVGTAVFNNKIGNSIFSISRIKLHEDYNFGVQSDLNISHMQNNIGLVFVAQPVLKLFLDSAVIGVYYALELREKKLVMVGFGNTEKSETIILQQQDYYQTGCVNPTWYYCICGIEYSNITYHESFGEGAPVLFNNVVVAIAATPAGSLTMKTNINYNIFTVIAPYLTWIEKSKTVSDLQLRSGFINFATRVENNICVIHVIHILVTIQTVQ